MTDETLLKHFNLLQHEFQKINNKYQSLKTKYDQLLLTIGNCITEDNFFVNLNKIVKGLYKDRKYSDFQFKLQNSVIPGHKIVFEANRSGSSKYDMSNIDEINLSNEDQFIGEQVLKWLYLQEFNDNQSQEILWKIMKVAHEFSLNYLKARCETGLIPKVKKDNCIYFYMKSSEVGVENLRNFCSNFIIGNWNEYESENFSCLEASLFLELLESQSDFPLHQAIKADRDDVVFLFMNENFSQLEELVNVINDDNEIALDLALASKRIELCQTLLINCANLNCVDNYGWSLLHKAVLRLDEFSACFLIENGCHVNPLSPDLLQTPLQLLAGTKLKSDEVENKEKITKIATFLIQNGADVNHIDSNNMTALCLSILSGNEGILKAILDCGRCTSINGVNAWCINKNKPRDTSTLQLVSAHPNMSLLPLWLAVCREYRPKLLNVYQNFKEDSCMKTSPTLILIENDADPGCLFDTETGNSILLELISNQMEDAVIFVLEAYNAKQKLQNSQIPNLLSTESLVNMTNNSKESSLHIAVENKLLCLCKILLNFGADPNAIRRKSLTIPNSLSIDDLCGSSESANSFISLKEEKVRHNNKSNGKDVFKHVRNDSSDSIISIMSAKTDDLNPFKEHMKAEIEDPDSLSLSLSINHRSNIINNLLLDTIVSKSTKEPAKPSNCFKSRKINTEKRLTIDLCSPTHLAIKTKNEKIINLFINHDEDNSLHRVNWLLNDSTGHSPFTLALCSGLITVADRIFRKLMKSQFKTTDVDKIVIDGYPLLHLAVIKNNIEMAQFLISIGCDINIKSPNGITTLQLATEKCNIEIVKILCLSGADSNIQYFEHSEDGFNGSNCPLWTALINNRFDIASILTEAGADVDMWSTDPIDDYEQTLLHRAILECKEEVASFLITHNCDIKTPRENKNSDIEKDESGFRYIEGNTPLHMACQLGMVLVVKKLLSNVEINVDAKNVKGQTPLHLAIQFQQEEVLKLLLDPKIKIKLSIRDNAGRTPFHIAMEMANQKAARSILKYHPNAADEVDNLGLNFLHVAVQTVNREAVFFLIQANANLNVRVKDPFQHTPLHLAIISGAPEDMIRSLILAGARIDDETIEKQNLIHLAVLHERTYLISFLLENGASTSHQDHKFETPLHLAIRGGNQSIIEILLINSSSTIRTKNLKGENILHILSTSAKENAVVIFSMIMEHYPDFPIDEKDACGNTALFLCGCNGYIRLGVALVMKGASLGCINNDGSTLFNCENISEQLITKLLDSLDNEPNWSDGELCVSCLCKFSIKNRKHHCRHCGRLVCGKCSVNEIPIIKFNIKKSVRVCEVCFNFLVNGKL